MVRALMMSPNANKHMAFRGHALLVQSPIQELYKKAPKLNVNAQR